MKLIKHPLLYLALLILVTALYISSQEAAPQTDDSIQEQPTRRDLYQSMREKGKIILVYPHSNAKLKALAQQLSEIPSRRTQLEARDDQTLTETDIKENILLLLGSPKSNTITNNLLHHFPFQIKATSIIFDGKEFRDSQTVISLPLYPNPQNNRLPIMLITAPEDQAIIALLEQKLKQEPSLFRWSRWGYEVYIQNRRLMMGHFDEKTWEMTKEIHFDYTHKGDTLLQTPHFQFISHISPPPQHPNTPTSLKQVAHACEASAQAILEFTNQKKPKHRIDIHLYSSAEDKGLMWLNTNQSHIDEKNGSVHTVFNDVYQDNFIGKENQVLLRLLLDQPKLMALEEGLSVFFTKHWQIKGYEHWSSHLFHSGNLPPLHEILDNQMQAEDSRLVLGCSAAAFVEFLIQHWGKERFLANYQTWEPSPAEIHGLETEWHNYLAQKPTPAFAIRDNQLPRLKGFNFAHEGYNIYNGYLSRMAAASLKKQVDLNANAVAIVPYTFLPDPNSPAYLRIARGSGMENDESVVYSAYQAKKLGMTTMLKPQIWLGRGSWPGDVEMKNEADWQLFFDHYYRWIRHYALMAEIYQMDLLCIGTEFAKATLQREEDWRRIIQKIRQLYSGKITYAANWGDEFEKLGFWDELDYIGLDCYYPLSKKEQPSQAELRKNFRAVIKKIETVTNRYNKPLIFTEIGFRSIDAPWKNPHADSGDAAFNGNHQALCYKIVLESLKGQDWCQGIFWWKFPTDLANMGWEEKGFTPNQKPAEAVVKEWFGRLE